MQLLSRPTRQWFAAMAALQRHTKEHAGLYRQIVGRLAIPAAFAALADDRGTAALAYGAIHDGLICYKSVVTDPEPAAARLCPPDYCQSGGLGRGPRRPRRLPRSRSRQPRRRHAVRTHSASGSSIATITAASPAPIAAERRPLAPIADGPRSGMWQKGERRPGAGARACRLPVIPVRLQLPAGAGICAPWRCGCSRRNFSATMAAMRMWLDERRFEPSSFTCLTRSAAFSSASISR